VFVAQFSHSCLLSGYTKLHVRLNRSIASFNLVNALEGKLRAIGHLTMQSRQCNILRRQIYHRIYCQDLLHQQHHYCQK
jgi:hypothetical protein